MHFFFLFPFFLFFKGTEYSLYQRVQVKNFKEQKREILLNVFKRKVYLKERFEHLGGFWKVKCTFEVLLFVRAKTTGFIFLKCVFVILFSQNPAKIFS